MKMLALTLLFTVVLIGNDVTADIIVCEECQSGQSWSLESFRKEFIETKGSLQRELEATKAQLAATNEKLAQSIIFGSQIPIGFTYVQLPKEKSPKEIWPHYHWTDETSNYAGLFFRAEGGGSADFGTVQHENFERISKMQYVWSADDDFIKTSFSPTPGHWRLKTGVFKKGFCDKDMQTGIDITVSGGELRPKNMAMRIWKRSA